MRRISRTKKGVSPVIGVILLIALTVAMVAIVWTMVGNYMNIQPLVTVETTDTTLTNRTGVWTGVINISSECSITFELSNSTHTISSTSGILDHNGNGDQSFSVGFNQITPGQYSLELHISNDGITELFLHNVGFS